MDIIIIVIKIVIIHLITMMMMMMMMMMRVQLGQVEAHMIFVKKITPAHFRKFENLPQKYA